MNGREGRIFRLRYAHVLAIVAPLVMGSLLASFLIEVVDAPLVASTILVFAWLFRAIRIRVEVTAHNVVIANEFRTYVVPRSEVTGIVIGAMHNGRPVGTIQAKRDVSASALLAIRRGPALQRVCKELAEALDVPFRDRAEAM